MKASAGHFVGVFGLGGGRRYGMDVVGIVGWFGARLSFRRGRGVSAADFGVVVDVESALHLRWERFDHAVVGFGDRVGRGAGRV